MTTIQTLPLPKRPRNINVSLLGIGTAVPPSMRRTRSPPSPKNSHATPINNEPGSAASFSAAASNPAAASSSKPNQPTPPT